MTEGKAAPAAPAEQGSRNLLMRVLAARMRSANAQQQRVDLLVRSFRNRGHAVARLDPLGRSPGAVDELALEYHGLSEAELDLPFSIRTAEGERTLPLRAIVEKLRNTYCRSIGVQFMHIDDRRVREWLQFRMEGSENRRRLSLAEQRRILAKLTDAELFEQFVAKKFLGAKRFSLEGAESLIPLLDVPVIGWFGGRAPDGRSNLVSLFEPEPETAPFFRVFNPILQGEKFDPNLHQAVAQAPGETPAGCVLDVAQPGYVIGDRTLRAAMVVVSTGPATASPAATRDGRTSRGT